MTERDYHGTIWVVSKTMTAESDKRNDINGRKVIIEKGEIIEFRFPSRMNFRTLDNKYYCVSEEVWLEHCIEVGKIYSEVRSNNRANTEEVWRLELFDWTENGRDTYHKIKGEENEALTNETKSD